MNIKRTMSINIEEKRYQQLVELCRKDGITPAAIMKGAIDKYVETHERGAPASTDARTE